MNKEHDINKNIEGEKYMFYNGKRTKIDLYVQVKREKEEKCSEATLFSCTGTSFLYYCTKKV